MTATAPSAPGKGPGLPALPTVNAVLRTAAASPYALTFLDAQERETALTWTRVLERAQAAAAALASLGVRHGDRVAIVIPTSPAFVDAFFGVLLAGAVPVPLYPPVRLGRMDEYHRATARMLSRVGAELVVSDARVRLLLGQAVAEARPPLGLVIAEELQGAVPVEMEDPRPEDLALIQFSSGSTVDPKPVALEHRHLVAQCAALQSLMPEPASSGALGVSWLPLYHDMGLIGALLSAAYYPGPLVLIPPEVFLGQPAIWLRAISRFRGTISPAPNFAYALCLKRVSQRELEGVDLRSWRYALNGAEPVSPEVLRRFSERYGPLGFDPASLMPVYGLSEASLAVTFSPRRSPAKTVSVDPRALAERSRAEAGTYELASVGRPVPGVEVEIRGQDGRALPERRVGRVWVRGPSVMRGYFEDEGATRAALPGGWLDTGDLGFLAEGELYLCGREKDLVIIRGANHAPQEFEVCLEGVPGVRPGCAVALGFTPEGGTSEELLILAERRGDASLDAAVEEAVRRAVVERTGIRPHTVKMLEPGTLPRTSSGKMRRREALRRFQAGQLTPPLRMGVMRFAAEVARSTLALARSRLKRSREGR
ncbi:MAG TPA: fatty acyl-AMP ligase [Myxococcales bacterium]|nr:fatty acyl-AMP ligase [Myxococcales bacterium]